MYQPRRRVPALRTAPEAGIDRFALGFAIFSAFLFVGTMMLLCAVTALAALLWRTESRWGQLAGWLAAQPPPGTFASPLALPATALPLEPTTAPIESVPIDSPLPEPPTPTVDAGPPTATPETLPPPVVDSPLPTPTLPSPLPVESTPVVPTPPGVPGSDPYLQAVATRLTTITGALSQLAVLLGTPQPADTIWREQVTGQSTLFSQLYSEINTLQPPPEQFTFHANLIPLIQNCLSAVYTVDEAVIANDLPVIQQGATALNNCLPPLTNAANTAASDQLNSGAP